MKYIIDVAHVYDLPYSADPPRTSEYVDLRTHPAKIEEIPELKSEPILKSLVSVLNDPGGCFMTHGCAVGAQKPGVLPIPKHAQNASCWYASYVTFSFWFLERNKNEHYREMYEKYPSNRNDCSVCFVLEPVHFCTPYERERGMKDHTNRTICLLWVSGWGSDTKEARDRWCCCIQEAVAFFSDSSSETKGSGVTVAQHMFQK